MKPVYGPFQRDPNASVALVAFDRGLFIVNRRAVHDVEGDAQWGVIELADARCFRSRKLEGREIAALPEDVGPTCWAWQLNDTEYLRDCIATNRERLPESPLHAHFLVLDGWDYAIDVVAGDIACRALSDPYQINLLDLMQPEGGYQLPR